ncbi:hypothetical protein [Thalassotalea eurytherma]|uniref:DUF4156 domain-containing protein n=1 Tax=Thalassotalea eurytherma TaxID=1144278 RepID=A0ABQ6H489_9GAMM|nr:hypothetical protein [Thalassotalea eurytherma]GLX81632.1 hypothetical protein theurythT_10840 [Thalassotalea eurytherma]
MRKFILIMMLPILTACSQTQEVDNGQSQWDFDHQVQFKQTKLSENAYRIEVIPNAKIKFDRLATFLIRHSLEVCNSYGFKLEVLTGIESFTDRKAHPNKIFGSLAANLECPSKASS